MFDDGENLGRNIGVEGAGPWYRRSGSEKQRSDLLELVADEFKSSFDEAGGPLAEREHQTWSCHCVVSKQDRADSRKLLLLSWRALTLIVNPTHLSTLRSGNKSATP